MIKCVAIDDEPIALDILREYCRRYGDMELQCFTSPVHGMECVRATLPDIVFLDIEMQSHNGIDLARELPAGTCLIFTTAFSQYALDGFNVDAVDFLHKPIFYPRFERAMEKARKYIGASVRDDSDGAVTLKSGHKNVVVNLGDILLIEAMDNYVKVIRRNMPTVLSQITMKDMESMLHDGLFVRVHRSYIVAVKAVERFSNRTIYLRDFGRPVPVGRKYVETFNNLNNIINNSNNS